MKCYRIEDVKEFMELLFLKDVFDKFCMDRSIKRFQIDTKIYSLLHTKVSNPAFNTSICFNRIIITFVLDSFLITIRYSKSYFFSENENNFHPTIIPLFCP